MVVTLPKKSKKKSKSRRIGKTIARELAVGIASDYVGRENARMGYRFLARRSKAKGENNLVLSRAASNWLSSFASPMNQMVMSIGLPRPPSQPSFKVKGFIRGTGFIGVNGVGWVAIAPTLANNAPAVYYTPSTYAIANMSGPPSDLTLAASQAGGVNYPAWVAMSNLPYSSTQLTTSSGVGSSSSDIAGRLVSCAFSVEYIGTTLNQSGQLYGYSDPDTNNVLGGNHIAANPGSGYFASELAQRDACEIYNVNDRRKMAISILPSDDNMDDYPRQSLSFSRKVFPYSSGETYTTNTSDTTSAGAAIAAIMLTGISQQQFYFEVVFHVEYIGAGVTQSLMTESSTDSVGYDAVKGLLAKAQRRVAGTGNQTFVKSLKKEMQKEKIVFGTGIRSH